MRALTRKLLRVVNQGLQPKDRMNAQNGSNRNRLKSGVVAALAMLALAAIATTVPALARVMPSALTS